MAHINKYGKWVFDNLLEAGEYIARKPQEYWTDDERRALCELLAPHKSVVKENGKISVINSYKSTYDTARIYKLLDKLGRTGDEHIL